MNDAPLIIKYFDVNLKCINKLNYLSGLTHDFKFCADYNETDLLFAKLPKGTTSLLMVNEQR